MAQGHALTWLLIFLSASAAYLYVLPQPNIFYAGVVLLHAFAGLITAFLLLLFLARRLRGRNLASRLGWILLTTGALVGLILIKTGTPRSQWNLMYLHIGLSLAALGVLIAEGAGSRRGTARGFSGSLSRYAIVLAVIGSLVAGARYLRETRWQHQARIENPPMPPATMNGEG
ncbi:MAG: hypothetical protein ACRDL7_11250, partial [Gaiellaceae bacterium]